MKTSIITITYDKDLEYLKYNLKSIQKFCHGYHENIVVIDDHENDCIETQKYLESIGQKYFVNKEAKKIKKGYIRQQYIKLFSEQYVSSDTDYICHVDTDNIFTDHHDPSIYFNDGKPILGIQKWSEMPSTNFKSYTDQTLEYESDYNFMRKMPLVYNFDLFPRLREYIINLKGELIDYLNTLETISEYNLLGAFAYKFHRGSFYWVDTHQNKNEWQELNSKFPCTQYSNRRYEQPHRYVDLSDPDNVIAKLFTIK